MTASPVIQCRGVTVAYGRDVVLDRFDLTVPRGALLPIIGPNGSGKTTLLKTCLGLIPHQGGQVICDFGDYPPAYVPQQKQLDPIFPVSVRDIVGMGLYAENGFWRQPNHTQQVRVAQIMARFGLTPHNEKHFGELSGGLRQKTLLARAVVSRADVLIMDEPTAGLDMASEAEMLSLIHSLHTQERKTILWVHHRLDQCAGMAQDLCLVEQGKVALVKAAEVGP